MNDKERLAKFADALELLCNEYHCVPMVVREEAGDVRQPDGSVISGGVRWKLEFIALSMPEQAETTTKTGGS